MRTRNAMMIEEAMRVATLPLDLEQDREIVEEVYYESVNPEEIECLMEFNGPGTALEEQEFKTVVQDLLDSLTLREAKVLIMRFGIGLDKEYSLEEVGKVFDRTRESIRQIEAKALRKMRHPSRSDKLKTFLEEDNPHRPSVFKEAFPDIDDYWGTEGMLEYTNAVEGWNRRRIAVQVKLELQRIQLKKGTLT